MCNSPGTLPSLLRYDSSWDFKEKFRGFYAVLTCLVGVYGKFGVGDEILRAIEKKR